MQRSLNVSLISHFNGFSAVWRGGNLVTRERKMNVGWLLSDSKCEMRFSRSGALKTAANTSYHLRQRTRSAGVKADCLRWRESCEEKEREVLIVLRAAGTLLVLITVDGWCFSHLLCWRGPGGVSAAGIMEVILQDWGVNSTEDRAELVLGFVSNHTHINAGGHLRYCMHSLTKPDLMSGPLFSSIWSRTIRKMTDWCLLLKTV